MFSINKNTENNNASNNRRLDVVSILHRVICVPCILLTVYFFISCIAGALSAWDDVIKFEHPRTFIYFLYYLDVNNIEANAAVFRWVFSEFLLYLFLYRRAERKKTIRGSGIYFLIMLIFHIGLWMHANAIPLPGGAFVSETDYVRRKYTTFANITLLPSVAYCILYNLRIHCNRSA